MTPSTHPGTLTAPSTPTAPARPDPKSTLVGLVDVLTAYRTCEFATVSKAGVPITWPAVCRFDRDAGRFTLTTTIGAPQKAFNIRRDPRVAMLFSDPTGTGRTDLPQILVQGTARCPDEIHTSAQGMEAYWRDLWRHQPASAAYGSSPIDRWLFDFYYMRLIITVDPTHVTVGQPLVRQAPPVAHRAGRRDTGPLAVVGRRLPEFPDAVLATVDGGAPPVLRRVRPTADPAGGTLVLTGADPAEIGGATAANLLLHSHDDELGRLRQLGLLGTLDVTGTGVLLRPTRVLQGGVDATNPLAMARALRRVRRTTQRYLDKRELGRPTIPWAEYHRLRPKT